MNERKAQLYTKVSYETLWTPHTKAYNSNYSHSWKLFSVWSVTNYFLWHKIF